MNKDLFTDFSRLESKLDSLIDSLEHVPMELMKVSGSEGKWSMNQVIVHLLTSEIGTYNYVKKQNR